ncbi:MAG: GNAT family N-acetyltransferase, partial [bacterium]|nr:GNAT family N-acetyltransferase [bacterium]
MLQDDPTYWNKQIRKWKDYDEAIHLYPETVGACVFLSWLEGIVVGFASWDPRGKPDLGIIGHNCILPEYRDRGLGKAQIEEVLHRFRKIGIAVAEVSTLDHDFFFPAQKMYLSVGFIASGR